MDINYDQIAGRAVAYAAQNNIQLDFSRESVERVDEILEVYHQHLSEYSGEEGANTLWDLAVHFGVYLGETMLRLRLREQGYEWYISDGLPVLQKDERNQMSPISKVHKRILNGTEDNVGHFCDVAFLIADGKFPTENVHRAVDVNLPSGQIIANIPYSKITPYIELIKDGEDDFLILVSQDGFLQFYGVGDQFVAEMRVNLPDGDYRTYSFINPKKAQQVERIQLTTPYGQFTPTEREVISFELLNMVIREYYDKVTEEDFLKSVPYIDTTQETKRYMGQ